MNEHEPEIDPEIDPEQEAHVRALLGEVGAEHEPIPDEVSARLDDTLAMLRAERVQAGDQAVELAADQAGDEAGELAGVVPLRRRWLPRAAGAAAAVIVLGVGGLAAVRLGTDSSSQDSAASGGVSSDTAPSSQGPSEAPVPSAGSGATPGSKARPLRESADALRALPVLTKATFDTDVAGLLRADTSLTTPAERAAAQSGVDAGSGSGSTSETTQQPDAARLARECPGPAVSDGAVANPVRLDGVLSVLLVHPAKDGEQRVEAWTCAGDRRLQSTRLTGDAVTP
jgi:hypothetical protein